MLVSTYDYKINIAEQWLYPHTKTIRSLKQQLKDENKINYNNYSSSLSRPSSIQLSINSVILLPFLIAVSLILIFKSGSTFIDSCLVPFSVMPIPCGIKFWFIISLFHLIFCVGKYIAFTIYGFLYSYVGFYIETHIYRFIHSNGWRR